MRCPNCGFENPPRFKFCGECGMPLETEGKSSQVKSVRGQTPKKARRLRKSELSETGPKPALQEAERRQLTVMFCDLVGSTALSEQLDPEELRDVVRDYQEVCAEVIDRLEGYIAKYLGDGLLVYFGYPMAHEDDAQRAVRAGLEIIGAVCELPLHTRLQQTLQVRVGIHTGLVVVGEMGGGKRREPMAIVGDTPNIAARLQGIAEPNTAVISSATYRLIQGYFTCQALGFQTLKGLSQPMEVYRVLHKSDVQSRFELAVTKGLTPLVGREQEVGLLMERWEQVKEGIGQVVLLSGEAGIGKSRLVQVLKEHVAGEPHVRIESRCSPYYQNSAFYPVIDHLQRLLQFRREDSPQEKLGKLERTLEHYSFSLQQMVPLFASLLSLPFPDSYPPLNLSPQRQKQKTLEALLVWLLKQAEKQPVLFIVEDLHWVDPSTMEFLNSLMERAPMARIFALLTFRSDFSPPWAAISSHTTQIMLSRLDHKQVEMMIDKVTGGKTLPAEVVQQVVVKTDGVPLFVEELTRMVLESGLLRKGHRQYELTGPLPPLAIPATLNDSLMARLDRLATVKEVTQLGATLGREFTYELILAVSPWDEATLQLELTRLVEAEILYQRGILPQAAYIFKHALIQEAAYQSLLKSKRQQYHQKVARALEKRFPETVDIQPELLAHHYTEAGLGGQAIPYWQKAGELATQRSANVEAINHLTKGLELLKTLPDTDERTQQELILQLALGVPLMATKGYAAPEVEKAYAQARERCLKVGETPQLFQVLGGLRLFYNVRGEQRTAHELAKQMMRLAQSVRDKALIVEAHRVLGAQLFWLGELTQARELLEQGIALYDPQKHHSSGFLYGQDSGVACLSYGARTLWLLGYPDQALKRSYKVLTLAQELSHPHSLVYALTMAATFVHLFRCEWQAAEKRAETAIALCNEQGFPLWLAAGTILRGWALVKQGYGEKGIAQMCQGLDATRATGAEIMRSHFLTLLAETYGKVGQAGEGLTLLTEALTAMNNSGEHWWEAELYRLKGELLLALSSENQGEAERCFRQAIEVARRRSAKSLELRAVTSLSRLLQKQGKKEEAQQMLAEIYGWFTEGFDTADLKEAGAMLQELS